MKKIGLTLMVLLALFAGIAFIGLMWWSTTYNTLVQKQEAAKQACGQVQNVYQRRADLIPNLVETVKGYAAHESETLEAVTRARQQVTQINVGDLLKDPDAQKRYLEAQGSLGSTLTRLLAVQEKYPNLKADQNFLSLQAELAGTENRISVERKRWQEATATYNVEVRGFWSGMVASRRGFEVMPYYEAQAGADTAPKVSFTKK